MPVVNGSGDLAGLLALDDLLAACSRCLAELAPRVAGKQIGLEHANRVHRSRAVHGSGLAFPETEDT